MNETARMIAIPNPRMFLRVAAAVAGLGFASPALALELTPDQARHFVAGKLFAYSCFDGTTGLGRIHGDGSVIGTLQAPGRPLRAVALPAGTIRVSTTSICAALPRAMFQPCFRVEQTSARSFRGSLSGLGFAYCDFVYRNPRADLVRGEARTQGTPPSEGGHSTVVLRPSVE